eukprot:6179693-Pleurochrysis_carterae.AAC.1
MLTSLSMNRASSSGKKSTFRIWWRLTCQRACRSPSKRCANPRLNLYPKWWKMLLRVSQRAPYHQPTSCPRISLSWEHSSIAQLKLGQTSPSPLEYSAAQ